MPTKKTVLTAVLCVCMMTTTTGAVSAPDADESSLFSATRRIVLENGLVVLIHPSHRAETFSLCLAVRSGASDEDRWLASGLSHFLEHMFFKGTPTRDKGAIERQVREMGGYINAYTGHDVTVYYVNALSRDLKKGMDLISDAAFNPALDPVEVEREREVILSELRMNEDRLSRQALEELWALRFTRHPYRHPVIGYEDLFKQLKAEDLRAFLDKYYAPNNMVLSVVGHFDADQAETLVKEYFGSQSRSVPLGTAKIDEPEQMSPRRHAFYMPAEHTRLYLGFPGTRFSHPDTPALDVLAQILGDGPSSRLERILREEEKLVLDADVSNSTLREAGLFGIETLMQTEKLEEVREALWRQIERIRREPPSEEELRRVRQQTMGQHYSRWESHGAIAHELAMNELYAGDYRYSDRYLEEIRRLKPEDIRRVAEKYLKAQQVNEVVLFPETMKAEGEKVKKVQVKKELGIRKVTLKNGMRVLLMEDHSTPMTYAYVSSLGGLLLEEEETAGAGLIASEMMMRGTATHDRRVINEMVADWGGDMDTSSGRNAMGMAMSFMSEYTSDALGLMIDMLRNPAFPREEFEKVLDHQKEALAAEKEDVFTHANRELARNIYKKHPYRLNPIGTEESLDRMTIDIARDFYRKALDPRRMVAAVFGDINAERMESDLESIFGSIAVPDLPPELPARPEDKITEICEASTELPKEQAVVMLAFNGVNSKDPDRHAYKLINAVMSGAAGRLYQTIRGEHGLSYVVSSSLSISVDPGYFVFYAAVEPKQAKDTMTRLVAEAQKLLDSGITAEELTLAKTQIMGNHEQSLESKASLARRAVTSELIGDGYESLEDFRKNIEDVTAEDVRRVINRYIRPENTVRLTVLPAKEGGPEDGNAES